MRLGGRGRMRAIALLGLSGLMSSYAVPVAMAAQGAGGGPEPLPPLERPEFAFPRFEGSVTGADEAAPKGERPAKEAAPTEAGTPARDTGATPPQAESAPSGAPSPQPGPAPAPAGPDVVTNDYSRAPQAPAQDPNAGAPEVESGIGAPTPPASDPVTHGHSQSDPLGMAAPPQPAPQVGASAASAPAAPQATYSATPSAPVAQAQATSTARSAGVGAASVADPPSAPGVEPTTISSGPAEAPVVGAPSSTITATPTAPPAVSAPVVPHGVTQATPTPAPQLLDATAAATVSEGIDAIELDPAELTTTPAPAADAPALSAGALDVGLVGDAPYVGLTPATTVDDDSDDDSEGLVAAAASAVTSGSSAASGTSNEPAGDASAPLSGAPPSVESPVSGAAESSIDPASDPGAARGPPSVSQLVTSTPGTGSQQATLDAATLAWAVEQAIASWTAALGAGDPRLAALAGIGHSVADLPGVTLGMNAGGTAQVDVDAAGHGWYVGGSATFTGGIDLLTVVRHELGHALGFDHDDAAEHAVMAELLEPRAPWVVTATGTADNAFVFATSGLDLLVTVDGVTTTRPAGTVTALAISGGDGDDSLMIGSLPQGLAVTFDGGAGSDTIHGPAPDTTWNVTGLGTGNVAGVSFTAVENLTGAADNEDTFVFAEGAAISGLADGGLGGFDTIELAAGPSPTLGYEPSGPDAGIITLDGRTIAFAGLEPVILALATPEDIVITYTATDANVTLAMTDEGGLALFSDTHEDLFFPVPTRSLTIHMFLPFSKLPGSDLTILPIDLGTARLTVHNADTLTVAGDITVAGEEGEDGIKLVARSLLKVNDGVTIEAGDADIELDVNANTEIEWSAVFPTFGDREAHGWLEIGDGAILRGRNVIVTVDSKVKALALFEIDLLLIGQVAGTVLTALLSEGTPVTFVPVVDPVIGVSAPDRIVRTTGSWIVDGFVADSWIRVAGGLLNDGFYRVTEVSADGFTLFLDPEVGEGFVVPEVALSDNLEIMEVVVGRTGLPLDIGPALSFDGNTITRHDGRDWSQDGFLTGQFLMIEGSPGGLNDNSYEIVAVAGDTLDVNAANHLTTQSNVSGAIAYAAAGSPADIPLAVRDPNVRMTPLVVPLTFAGDTITRHDPGGSWVTDGFADNQTILVTGATANAGTYEVVSVSATTLRISRSAFVAEQVTSGVDVATVVAAEPTAAKPGDRRTSCSTARRRRSRARTAPTGRATASWRASASRSPAAPTTTAATLSPGSTAPPYARGRHRRRGRGRPSRRRTPTRARAGEIVSVMVSLIRTAAQFDGNLRSPARAEAGRRTGSSVGRPDRR